MKQTIAMAQLIQTGGVDKITSLANKVSLQTPS